MILYIDLGLKATKLPFSFRGIFESCIQFSYPYVNKKETVRVNGYQTCSSLYFPLVFFIKREFKLLSKSLKEPEIIPLNIVL